MTAPAPWIAAARALALDDAAVAAATLLEAAGIDVLLLKGPVTAARLYAETPAVREYCDVDLLVAPHRFADAEATLAGAGYQPAYPGIRASERNDREVAWYSPGPDRLTIDLHRSLAGVGNPGALWSRLWRERTTMVLQAALLQVPDAAGSALVIALHASRPGNTRKPFRDLARAVVVFDDVQWRRAIGIARECEAVAGLVLGLDSVPEARPLLARFDLEALAPASMRLYAYGTSPAGLAFGRLLAGHGGWGRLRILAGGACPSVAFMHTAWPASASGPVALVRAYGQRWVRLARSLPRGLAELAGAVRGGPVGRDTWTHDTLDAVQRQLVETGIQLVRPIRPPGRTVTERSVETILQRRGASCLERSVVRQHFHGSRGQQRDLIVGFAPRSEAFRAHAWLSGDVEDSDDRYLVLYRTGAPVTEPHATAPAGFSSPSTICIDEIQRRDDSS